jgi:hypothetical protein
MNHSRGNYPDTNPGRQQFKSGAASGKIGVMLRESTLASVCAMLLWLGGCPKRQERQSVLVYVPAPPPPAAAPAPANSAPRMLVIEQPPPPPEPKPEETPTPQSQGPAVAHRRRIPTTTTTPAEADETSTPDDATNPAPEVPALESSESSAQENELRKRYQNLAQDIRQRLARLNGNQLSGDDRRTLEDARTFYLQSAHAMATGDLPRALNLAQKSDLLLTALE